MRKKMKQQNRTYKIQREGVLWKKMHFKNGIKILQLFCTLKKIEFYEIIDPIWNNTGIIYGISEKEAVGTKERN